MNIFVIKVALLNQEVLILIPNATITGISRVNISFELIIGFTIPTIPTTDKILNKFDPIIFPTDIECCFLNDATTQVDSSGNDVPSATTDIPITISLTPINLARLTAPLTNRSAPKYNPITPKMNKNIALLIFFSVDTGSISATRLNLINDHIYRYQSTK